jgi:hypothetical protein
MKRNLRRTHIALVIVLLSLALAITPTLAQQQATPTAPGSSITFSGTIDSFDTNYVVVNGLLVNLDGADISRALIQIGAPITVVGNLQNGVIQATRLRSGGDDDDDGSGVVTPQSITAPTATPTPVGETRRPRIVIEGPVREISGTTMRIFDQVITINPNTTNITNIRVGDNVRVEGDFTIINNTFNIVAVNVRVVTGGGRGSDRNSGNNNGSNRNSIDNNISDRNSDRPVQPPPPPPPPQPRGSNSGASAASGRSS